MNRNALDRYITGNYGEDQYREQPRATGWFRIGMEARRHGKPQSDCPYAGGMRRREWIAGWCDEDMSLKQDA